MRKLNSDSISIELPVSTFGKHRSNMTQPEIAACEFERKLKGKKIDQGYLSCLVMAFETGYEWALSDRLKTIEQ